MATINSSSMSFVILDRVTLHYRYHAPKPGYPVVVFSNSLGTDFRIWEDVVRRLPSVTGVLLYDKRGHGLSDSTVCTHGLSSHVKDLALLMDHLKVGHAVLVGLSVGGMIAQQLASTRPDLVRALVLCDTAHRIGTQEQWDQRIAAVRSGGIASIADAILERWFSAEFRRADNAAFHACRTMLCQQSVTGYTSTCAAIRDTDLSESSAALKLPTVCLVGDQDGATPPELVKATAALIPNARFFVIDNAGHLPCIEQPQAVVDHIRALLEGLDRACGRLGRQAPLSDTQEIDSGTVAAADVFHHGMRVRRAVLGDAHVDRAEQSKSSIDASFQRFITETAWGRVWASDYWTRRERSIVTLALLASQGHWDEMAMHVRASTRTGATEDDLRETFMHVAIYAGIPAANHAFTVARRALEDVQQAHSTPPGPDSVPDGELDA